jgi:hypothetical protein
MKTQLASFNLTRKLSLFATLGLTVSFCTWAAAQTTRSSVPSAERNSSGQDEPDPFGLQSPAAEALVKRRIKLAEKEHKETVDRARETAQLGSELRESVRRVKSLLPEDLKKLERMEKLTKKIRGEAGGSDDAAEITNAPHDLESAVAKLTELSSELCERVEKTSRMEVSAAVIERANQLLELIRMLKLMRPSNT